MGNDLSEIIKRAAGTYGKVEVKTFDANVTSVDEKSRTCVVDSLDLSIENITVRFMSEISDGSMQTPSINSTVTVVMTAFTDPYIVSNTWLDKLSNIVGDTEITLVDGQVSIQQGKMQIILKNGKISITNTDTNESLFNILKSMFENIKQITVNTGGGVSDPPNNIPAFTQNEDDLSNLMF